MMTLSPLWTWIGYSMAATSYSMPFWSHDWCRHCDWSSWDLIIRSRKIFSLFFLSNSLSISLLFCLFADCKREKEKLVLKTDGPTTGLYANLLSRELKSYNDKEFVQLGVEIFFSPLSYFYIFEDMPMRTKMDMVIVYKLC